MRPVRKEAWRANFQKAATVTNLGPSRFVQSRLETKSAVANGFISAETGRIAQGDGASAHICAGDSNT